MRKVKFTHNSWDTQNAGYFHCWAGTMQEAYALIEDENGKVHKVHSDHLIFVTSPEDEINPQKIDIVFGGRKVERIDELTSLGFSFDPDKRTDIIGFQF